jgi:hypothetical protein
MRQGNRLSLLIILLFVLALSGCQFFLSIFPWEEMGDIQVMVTFADLSPDHNFLVDTYEWHVWIDVDANVGTGRSIADDYEGSDVELLFSTPPIDTDVGSYQDPGSLFDYVSLSHKDAELYTWSGATGTIQGQFQPNVLVDGNIFVFGSFASWEPYANLDSNFVVRIQVITPSGSDSTSPAGLTGNGSVTDTAGDAGGSTFADILSVRALFNVP